MSDQPTRSNIYRHYKGEEYVFIMVAKDEATQAELAVYRSNKTQQVWVRPLAEFCEPRFTRMLSAPEPDMEWEHFYKVSEKLPKEREGTMMVRLATGEKVPAAYEDGKWRFYGGYRYSISWGKVLNNVIEWRYPASK